MQSSFFHPTHSKTRGPSFLRTWEREEALKLSLTRGCTMGRNQTYFFLLYSPSNLSDRCVFYPFSLIWMGFLFSSLPFFCFFVRHLALSHHHGRISLQHHTPKITKTANFIVTNLQVYKTGPLTGHAWANLVLYYTVEKLEIKNLWNAI